MTRDQVEAKVCNILFEHGLDNPAVLARAGSQQLTDYVMGLLNQQAVRSDAEVLAVSVTNQGGQFAVHIEVPPGDPDPTVMAEACWSVSTKMSSLIAHYGHLAAIRVPPEPESGS